MQKAKEYNETRSTIRIFTAIDMQFILYIVLILYIENSSTPFISFRIYDFSHVCILDYTTNPILCGGKYQNNMSRWLLTIVIVR